MSGTNLSVSFPARTRLGLVLPPDSLQTFLCCVSSNVQPAVNFSVMTDVAIFNWFSRGWDNT